jgi:hypothetical protein
VKIDDDGNGFIVNPDELKDYELCAIAGVYYYLNDHIYASAFASYSILPIRNHAGGQSF